MLTTKFVSSIMSVNTTSKNLVIIDAKLEDSFTLAIGVIPGTEVFILDSYTDGIGQITNILREIKNVEALHLVSHGESGCLYLGNSELSVKTLNSYREELQQWSQFFTDNAEILVYGCQVGENTSFIEELHRLTRAKIAASNTLVGNSAKGGNWNLEVTTGEITTPLAFSAATREAYPGVLATVNLTVNTTVDQNDGGAVAGLSLRDAILIANADPDNDYVIDVQPGATYLLHLGSAEEDAAAEGDLDITAGANITIRAVGGDRAIIDAGGFLQGDRVFHVLSEATLNLENVTLTRGNGIRQGGGIRIEEDGTATLIDSTVSGNSASSDGGGIYNSGTATLTNSTVSGNSAYDGGGIYNDGDYRRNILVTLTNSTVSGNSAKNGGGIKNEGTATLTNSTVSGNTAENFGGGIDNRNGTATLTKSIVSGNTARTRDGGGINNSFGVATLINSTVSGNSADDNGGGIDNSFGTATLTNSTVSGNSADDGGGIDNSGTVTLTNSTVSGNSADDDGGGINNDGTAILTNNTIANNTADVDNDGDGDGGGIFNDSGFVNLRNNIVAENFDNTTSSGEIHPDVSGDITGNNSNLVGNLSGGSGTIGTGTDIVNPDPLIGPLQDNGGATLTHALLEGSPAINAGNNILIAPDTVDLDGDGDTSESVPFDLRGVGFARVLDGTVDIGAFEGVGTNNTGNVDRDFNGDRHPEILIRNSQNNWNGLWMMNETTVSDSVGIIAWEGWTPIGTGDFNNDNQTDIVIHNEANNWNGVWFMDGTEVIGSAPLPVWDGWDIVGTGDFDNDNQTDIIIHNEANNWNGVWLMDGTNIKDSFGLPVWDGWAIAGTGDYNNDGKDDILVHNDANNWNGVWYMDGSNFTGSEGLLAWDGWDMVGAGDYNNDGQDDILIRNDANNWNGVWYMNGSTVTGSAGLLAWDGWDIV